MKWKNILAVPALALTTSLCLFSNAVALDVSQNNAGTTLVTMEPLDSYALVRNLTPFELAFGFCPGSTAHVVEAYDEQGNQSYLEVLCDVVHVRIAGLSGNNAAVAGGFGVGLDLPGTLDIRGGADKDTVIFDGDVSVGKLLITLRGGNNRIRGAANAFDFSNNTGSYIPFTSGSITVNTTLDIDTNAGNDKANFRALTVGGTADINLGGGDDAANIYGGGGPNSFNKLFMRLGTGDNTGSIRNATCHICQVFGGGGSDDILIKNVSAGIDVDAIAGGGDDTVELKNVTSGTDVNANGGPGTDCLIDDGSATTVSNFEPCTS